ncbi:hypothetical protein I302_109077 [Kwoniella bestiolae CBS 10118]|uniref:Solute carrier family 35 (UDP-xylose/UDP-N-acetylglucosamine transporter), member B4 n=1 Tax=Kwoniella bestiolae CBS 10118 TaxID=1296100 RepID=A0A1B9FUY1_9TREE|nr:hypothetical protein I302_08221 [Kwoniella bestiolae CBS 10118]OCF22571.1 hypothetical protein I302_08221 [Kwoniella bestiolae CBS 10118]
MVDRSLVSAVLQSSAGEWALILGLVFGGCCSNVWALEGVLKNHPKSGTFLTFVQILYVTITTLSSQLTWKKIPKVSVPYPTFKPRKVPIGRWGVQVVLFLAVSLMNNYAFGLKIPVTVHIILRSGGLCVSMLVGRIFGNRRYSFGQVLAALLITTGIILATISAPRPPRPPHTQATQASSPSSHTLSEPSPSYKYIPEHLEYFAGVGLLTVAMIIGAFLGMWQEQTYRIYGKQWREALFYGHALSLPFFIPLRTSLQSTYKSYASSSPISLSSLSLPVPIISSFPIPFPTYNPIKTILGGHADLLIPSALLGLLINVITQGLCVRGVNRLTSRVNSVTVNLVLTVRKAVSLGISVWWYQSGFNVGLGVGGMMVLFGTILYSFAPGPKGLPETTPKQKDKMKNISDTTQIEVEKDSRTISASAVNGHSHIRAGVRSRKARAIEG